MDLLQQDFAPSSPADAVKVSVRVRPLNARELASISGSKVSWAIDQTCITQCVNSKPIAANSFSFDHVFQQGVANEEIFTELAKPVVTSAADGINGVIFAYGQTAAGKTYTMLGTESDPGITRRSIAEAFRIISACPNRQFLLRASYIEIYNEVIRDLLAPDNDNLKIHEDVINKRVFVDSREEVVTSVGQVMDIIAGGEKVRAVGETNMNDRSSRSHTIFSLKIESREMSVAEAEGEDSATDEGVAVRASTLSLVDLAGSERASFTKAQGMRLVEGGHINKSLLTLGTVINKLSSGEARSYAHIPFRDSKLTRLLQPALGGNARTAIVCAVTPAILHMEETLSTLKFASRAKKVTNQAKTNEFLDDRAKLRRAEKEIARLSAECQRLKAGRRPDASKGVRVSLTDELSNQQRKACRLTFEKKFNILIKALREQDITLDVKERSLGYHGTMRPTNSIDALNLCCKNHSNDSNSKVVDKNVENEVAELRRRTFAAEREKRQALAEINYERQAMIAEVEVLLATSEEAERARASAENECAEVNSMLARQVASSLVGEVVTEVVTTSLVSGELKEAKANLDVLRNVKKKNSDLQCDISSLRKEHADIVKREKRGIGPILKDVKFLEGKLADLDRKYKTVRQSASQSSSEKAAVERELKNMQRQNKVLTGEVTKHRNHVTKGQVRADKKLEGEKKSLEKCVEGLRCEISTLSRTNGEKEEDLNATRKNMDKLKTELDEITLARDNLVKERQVALEKYSELSGKLAISQELCRELEQERQKLQDGRASVTSEFSELTEELGKAHLEIEEMRSELSELMKVADDAKKDRAKAVLEHEQAKIQLSEIGKTKGKMESSLLEQGLVNENLQQVIQNKDKVVNEQIETIKTLEESIDEYKGAQESSNVVLAEASSKKRDLMDQLTDANRLNEELRDAKCPECETMLGQLHSLQQTVAEMEGRTSRISAIKSAEEHEQLTVMRKENRSLHNEVEKLSLETKTRTREILKLSETIRSRDRKIYAMEDTLAKLGRGEGRIAALEQRCHRREMMIGELNRRLELQERILEEGRLPDLFKNGERILELESKYSALLVDQKEREQVVQRLQSEREAMVEESRKLRDIIKDRDIRRVREAAMKKDAQHDEVRRKRDVLHSIPLNATGR